MKQRESERERERKKVREKYIIRKIVKDIDWKFTVGYLNYNHIQLLTPYYNIVHDLGIIASLRII